MLPLCRAEGIGVIPWSPLARGFLAGNRSRDGKGQTTRANSDNVILQSNVFSESDYATRDKVEEIARQRNVSSAQVALAWLLHQPAVSAPIVGASKLDHLDDAIAARREADKTTADGIRECNKKLDAISGRLIETATAGGPVHGG